MKLFFRPPVLLFALTAVAAAALGQESPLSVPPGGLPVLNDSVAVRTLHASGAVAALAPSAAPELALFSYSILSNRDKSVKTGIMVGRTPFARGLRSTAVPVVIIPLILNFNFGGTPGAIGTPTGTYTSDPTLADAGCLGTGRSALSVTQASPLFSPAPFTVNGVNVGTTTYIDAFQRAEFWSVIGAAGNAYHLDLTSQLSTMPPQVVNLTASSSSPTNVNVRFYTGVCGTPSRTNDAGALGVVNINTMDPILRGLIATLGIAPTQFPFFVVYNTVMSLGDALTSGCCVLGYHDAYNETGSQTPGPGQTYGIGEFDGQKLFANSADVATLSHELGEWANDPGTLNLIAPWGGEGQVGTNSCQGALEVGDPLSAILFAPSFPLNGFPYHLQELAFFSWFIGSPSLGAGGKYSNAGTFSGFAKACPPGGTN